MLAVVRLKPLQPEALAWYDAHETQATHGLDRSAKYLRGKRSAT